MIKLKEISKIHSGYLFPKRAANDPNGNCRFIQLKDIDKRGKLNVENLVKIKIKKPKAESFIRKDDILFKSKSNNNTACVITESFDNIMASAHFFVLRITSEDILPEYLAWYINQSVARRYFKYFSSGSTISVVTKKVLGELEVKILPPATQQKVVELSKLKSREQDILSNISALKNRVYEQKTLFLIK